MKNERKLGGASSILPLIYALGWGGFNKRYNPPDADDRVISPPQSEESKLFYLKRAEEKRQRKLNQQQPTEH
jgi:hypothetical protein